MKVLSLFDGMACGMLAMQGAGIEVERYVAFEIDKYAVQTASHNFPMIEQRGDVFAADFSEFEGFDFLVGGSPCTYWSIAQKNNRETEASGMGWELFSQYVRALHEAKPRYFVYENNKSMSNAIRESITNAFGFEPICINSALVSAQNRQRLYWVGKREADGTYSKVDIQQPDDRGVFVKDILDGAYCFNETQNGKSYCLDAHYWKTPGSPAVFLEKKHARGSRTMVAERVSTVLNVNPSGKGMNGSVGRVDAKSRCLTTNKGEGAKIIVPVCMRYQRSDEAKRLRKQYEAGEVKHGFRELSELHPRLDGKTNTLSTVLKDNPICEPVCVAERGRYTADGSIEQRYEAREDGKTNTLTTVQKDNNVCEPVCAAYAIPVEFCGDRPVKAMSFADGKTYDVYEVRDGKITIKGKQYPIKLPNGFYIIRKLTVRECMRLQTVPDFYEFPVSDAQAYKILGNGWTVKVIVHLVKGCVAA